MESAGKVAVFFVHHISFFKHHLQNKGIEVMANLDVSIPVFVCVVMFKRDILANPAKRAMMQE